MRRKHTHCILWGECKGFSDFGTFLTACVRLTIHKELRSMRVKLTCPRTSSPVLMTFQIKTYLSFKPFKTIKNNNNNKTTYRLGIINLTLIRQQRNKLRDSEIPCMNSKLSKMIRLFISVSLSNEYLWTRLFRLIKDYIYVCMYVCMSPRELSNWHTTFH